MSSRSLRVIARVAAAGLLLSLVAAGHPHARSEPGPAARPIQHVIVVDMENHSFDNVLGQLCVQHAAGTIHRPGYDMGCEGVANGWVNDQYGKRQIKLSVAKDIVVNAGHGPDSQRAAMRGRHMDSFNLVSGCDHANGYRCYTQYYPSQIPNTYALAESFAISDHMFESGASASWGSHLEMVAGTFDGFLGYNPKGDLLPGHKGWGCDSLRDAYHRESNGTKTMQPACVPDYSLDPIQYPYGGAYRATTVKHVPSLMDEATSAGVPWRIYVNPNGSWNRALCPYFGSCLYTTQRDNVLRTGKFFRDAQEGKLPALSFLMPSVANSQHNDASMLQGDNWIGDVVSAVENGPDWTSSVLFLTWDDCGCFYDHLPPPRDSHLGIRLPFIIISPYAKPGYTDTHKASFDSIARYAEETLGIPSMGGADATAYDFRRSLDYSQQPLRPVPMVRSRIPRWEVAYLAAHPVNPDDPT